jgi:hypothetical protein
MDRIKRNSRVATWTGIYLVGLSKKNDLGWSFRQMRAKLVFFILKMIINRGVFCGQIRPVLKKIINATRRRILMRFFCLRAATLETIVIMVIKHIKPFAEKAVGVLGGRLNGTLTVEI